MSSSQQDRPHTDAVLAVVVLYGMQASDSPALCALLAPGNRLHVLVWDNSPTVGFPLSGPDLTFHADPANPGLASPYNAALQMAHERGATWLLLLDQDTVATPAYFDEVFTATAAAGSHVVALVPRLVHHAAVVSPVAPRLLGPHRPYREGLPLQAFNSGAVLRVDAMRALGGFDRRFPLDYLDHATFAALQANGGAVQVLQATLEHPLSTDTAHALSPAERARQAQILTAERRFFRTYGSAADRLLLPLRFLRRAASVAAHKQDWRSAAQLARAAFGFTGRA